MKTDKWLGTSFESSSVKTPEFMAFARDFKSDLKKLLKPTDTLVFNVGHFYVFGFIERAGKVAYFGISDVRHFPAAWKYNVLYRTATDFKDYTGGCNRYTTFGKGLKDKLDKLFEEVMA